MRSMNLDQGWQFSHGMIDTVKMLHGAGEDTLGEVNLPHDYMISSEVSPDAPPKAASGFYTAATANYTKKVMIPEDWDGDRIFLKFDGAMMNATVDINGGRAALQHYGYAPFCVDITPYVYPGKKNRVTVTVNPSMQPNSRWYSGAGLFRSVSLVHTPQLYIENDGIFAYTDQIEYNEDGSAAYAVLRIQTDVRNATPENRLADVTVSLFHDTGRGEETKGEALESRTARIQINPGASETAFMTMTVPVPELWSAEHPALYRVRATVKNAGVFRTHLTEEADGLIPADSQERLFGIREIAVDVTHGLRINRRTVKLRGGCLHHDNGILGAVSLYDAEYRKLSKLKESGFNAVRTTHNPPSAAFIEACDRLGLYVFDEAFDAWGMAKQPGDYSMFFDTDWEKDLTAFVRRDRTSPSVILWSTGNEIGERGGLNNGYTLAGKLARKVKSLDPSRPVSNAVCSFWNGLDEELMAESMRKMRESFGTDGIQNADVGGKKDLTWEQYTNAYTNGLDVVGYNYLEDKYETDHKLFPDRVMLGSENYPNEIGLRWPLVESLPYVLGDFTWTAFDYIGEAGIGRSAFMEKDDPRLALGPFALMSFGAQFPWRLANDADYDICGNLTAQGAYRQVIWGSRKTHLYSYDPSVYQLTEVISKWGFTDVRHSWNWAGQEGNPVRIAVFSGADSVEVLVNGRSLGVKHQDEARAAGMPGTFLFETVYETGTVRAVSYAKDGSVISEDTLETTGAPAKLVLKAERLEAPADGHSLVYVDVEVQDAQGRLVPDAERKLHAGVVGAASLAGFGAGNPVTTENYTSGTFTSFRGRALAVLRTGYEAGEAILKLESDTIGDTSLTIQIR